jgi:hypothetical protein
MVPIKGLILGPSFHILSCKELPQPTIALCVAAALVHMFVVTGGDCGNDTGAALFDSLACNVANILVLLSPSCP